MTINAAERRKLLAEVEIINASLTNAREQVRLLRNLLTDLVHDIQRVSTAYDVLAGQISDELAKP